MLDLIVVTIVSVFLLVGFVRGFLKEFFGIIGILISIIVTMHNYDIFIVLFEVKRSVFSHIISAVVTYVFVIIFMMILNHFLMSAIKSIRHTTLDKMFGLLTGALKGVVISYAFVFLLQLFYCSLYINTENDLKEKEKLLPSWLIKSNVYPIFNALDDLLDDVIPEDFYEDLKAFSYSLSEAMEKDVSENNSSLENRDKKHTKLSK